jgi:predicted nucleotidyltransferase
MQRIYSALSKPRFLNRKAVVESLRDIARKIARSDKKVDQIYLFGSMSTNDAGLHSDADLLIVLKEDNRPMLERLDEYLIKFSDGPIPVDTFVYTKEELKKALQEGNSFIWNALHGIKLAG